MTDQTKPSSEKITEALQLLEEAAKDKKAELKGLVANKYKNVRDVFFSSEEQVAEALKKAKDASAEKIKEVSGAVDQEVHRNPWPYIGGAAVGALLLGYIMGKKSS
ncbi:MAG: hypothetical protein ABIK83_14360 [Candidatus Zixiibacteriota bacterium]